MADKSAHGFCTLESLIVKWKETPIIFASAGSFTITETCNMLRCGGTEPIDAENRHKVKIKHLLCEDLWSNQN